MPPTLAARWMTASAPLSASRQAARSRRSWSAERIVVTSAPRSSSIPTVGRPRNPPPPVTVTRFWAQKAGSGEAEAMAKGYPRGGRYRSPRESRGFSRRDSARDRHQAAQAVELAGRRRALGVPRSPLLPHQAGAPDSLQAELLRGRLGDLPAARARL